MLRVAQKEPLPYPALPETLFHLIRDIEVRPLRGSIEPQLFPEALHGKPSSFFSLSAIDDPSLARKIVGSVLGAPAKGG